jgi:hypothetical protein
LVDWTNKVLYVLDFKRTSDQRRDYRERGESRTMAQHDILVRSLTKVAEDAEGENGGWKIKLIIFVGGTSGCTHRLLMTISRNFRSLSKKEMRLGKVSFMSCSTHKIRFCVRISRRGRESGVNVKTKKMQRMKYSKANPK